MKRPTQTGLPTSPRKRGLSEDDRALWDAVTKAVKPLRKKSRLTKVMTDEAIEGDVKPQPARKAKLLMTTEPSPPPAKPSPPPLAPIARVERGKIAKGRKEIQARIDLHGMTQARAHRALQDFLMRAYHDGLSLVLVITGKGKVGAEAERGVLRRQVPHWLALPEFRHLVIGFDEAHVGHGGQGALYVRVRRPR